MIKIEFDNQKLNVPDSWKDIKLADYEKWYTRQPQTYAEKVQYVADVAGIDVNILLNSPTQLFDIVAKSIDFIFDNHFDAKDNVEINGTEFRISFADKLTLGEWVDVESLIDSESEHKLSELLAILCRPAGEKYDADKVTERVDLFKNLSCDKALPLISFFLSRKKESEEILHHYSTAIAQASQFLRDTETFVINGDGIKQFPIWQRIRYTYLTRSLRKQLSKFSDSSFTE